MVRRMQIPADESTSSRKAVLSLLKREGPVSAEILAERVGITAMAVRQHLYVLQTDGLVEYREQSKGRGRPVKLWRTTERANRHFADSHAALTSDLIGQMRKAFGDRGLDKLLKLRTAEQEKVYRAELDDKRTLKGRVDALARIREREGYMAEVRLDPETGDLLLVENHCPVCAAARVCTGLCREEIALFERVLGRHVRVERLTHILAGAGRCTYRISEA